jgi:hypothetical protein
VKLGYEYRMDGHFLVRLKCSLCGKNYDVIALSSSKFVKLCGDCEKVKVKEN